MQKSSDMHVLKSFLSFRGIVFLSLSLSMSLVAVAKTPEREFRTKSGIQVYEVGEGFPLVILTGGPGYSSLAYRLSLKPLASTARLIFLDYRGTGGSRGFSEFGLKRDRSDFKSVVKELKLKRFDLLAHSYGGLLAIPYAHDQPEKVRKLILVSTPTNLPALLPGYQLRLKEKLGAKLYDRNQVLNATIKKHPEGASYKEKRESAEIEARYHLGASSEALIDLIASDYNFDTNAKTTDWTNEFLDPLLPQVWAKTLIVLGEQDAVVPAEFCDSLSKIPHSKRIEMKGVGHWSFLEEPDAFNKVIGDFLK